MPGASSTDPKLLRSIRSRRTWARSPSHIGHPASRTRTSCAGRHDGADRLNAVEQLLQNCFAADLCWRRFLRPTGIRGSSEWLDLSRDPAPFLANCVLSPAATSSTGTPVHPGRARPPQDASGSILDTTDTRDRDQTHRRNRLLAACFAVGAAPPPEAPQAGHSQPANRRPRKAGHPGPIAGPPAPLGAPPRLPTAQPLAAAR